MIMAAGPLITAIMQVYTALASRLPQRRVIQITQAGFAAMLIGFSVIFRIGEGWWSAGGVFLFRLMLGALWPASSGHWPTMSTTRDKRNASLRSSAPEPRWVR